MKRLLQIALVGVLLLVGLSLATAQQEPQPVVRLGNFIEVGNDVWMHILATTDFRYQTVHNFDFENNVRDAVAARAPSDTREQTGDYDGMWQLLRFGVDFKYQKSLSLHLTGEERQNLDANIVDNRNNLNNPGGTDVFGRAAATENNGLHFIYAYLDYKFVGTPLRLRVGHDLWTLDQAGTIGDNDPRIAFFGDFGDFDVLASAVRGYSSQRLGLGHGDNDYWYFPFSFGYNRKPHRFQVDVVYFRDRFAGADTQAATRGVISIGSVPIGFQGQKTDSVEIIGSWTGSLGPVRGLLQGAIITGNARGGVKGIPTNAAGIPVNAPGREYSIFAGSVIGYVEGDLGIVRPFLFGLFGTGDGDQRDKKLHGFIPREHGSITLMTGTGALAHLDISHNFSRDYACPARAQGLGTDPNTPGVAAANPGAPGLPRSPENIGIQVLGGTPARRFSECSHIVGNPFNSALGLVSHLGILSFYSNPGTVLGIAGLRVFPLKGHELVGYYAYRQMVNAHLLSVAFAPERAARGRGPIHTSEYHELGSSWIWTLNPNFDIRLVGDLAIAAEGYKDLARLATCSSVPGGGIPAGQTYATASRCGGKNLALYSELRFRARF